MFKPQDLLLLLQLLDWSIPAPKSGLTISSFSFLADGIAKPV
jgi:hypothetical protein